MIEDPNDFNRSYSTVKMKRKCVELLTKLNCGAEMKTGKILWLRLLTIMNRVFRNKLYQLNNSVEVSHLAINHGPTAISTTTTRTDTRAVTRNPGIGEHATVISNSSTATNTHLTASPTTTNRNPRIGEHATVSSNSSTATNTRLTASPTTTTRNPRIGVHPTVINHSQTSMIAHQTTTRTDPTATTRNP